MIESYHLMLMGGIAAGHLMASLFFLRFWRETRDRFFLYFAASFLIEAGNRVALGMVLDVAEDNPLLYMVRVVAYGLILLAILQKNRPPRA
jgi:hypothetical protein